MSSPVKETVSKENFGLRDAAPNPFAVRRILTRNKDIFLFWVVLGHAMCARPTRGVRDRVLREHRRSSAPIPPQRVASCNRTSRLPNARILSERGNRDVLHFHPRRGPCLCAAATPFSFSALTRQNFEWGIRGFPSPDIRVQRCALKHGAVECQP